MGIKIVIPANSYDAIENAYPTGHPNVCIEEYVWNMVSGMEQYVCTHYQHIAAEVKKVGIKWFNISQIYSLLRLGSRT